MALRNFVRLFSIVVVVLGISALSLAATYLVGSCKPGFLSFTTISAALAATPAPSVVEVCPGTYPEQVEITQPVTLTGINVDLSAQVVITPPPSGLVSMFLLGRGQTAPQIWVNNVSGGPVNIYNLTVDGKAASGASPDATVIGVLFENSSGVVKHVTTRNQIGLNLMGFLGIGVDIEGGTSPQSVEVLDCSIHDFGPAGTGISATDNAAVALTLTISGNIVDANLRGSNVSASGIELGDFGPGLSANITGNTVMGSKDGWGILASPLGSGSISNNTLISDLIGIGVENGFSVLHNHILNSNLAAIELGFPVKLAPVQGNVIVNSSIGIDFVCSSDPNVNSNTISDAPTGLNLVPAGVISINQYFNVGTIQTGGC